jgi:hypothetical protein
LGGSPRLKPLLKNAEIAGVKTAVIWTGSDVWRLTQKHSWWAGVDLNPTTNLALHWRLVEELQACGVSCHTALGSYVNKSDLPSPAPYSESFNRVAVYMPNDGAIYRFNEVCDIMDALPHVQFELYGNPFNYAGSPANVRQHGVLPGFKAVADLINSCNVLLRFTRHDGMPQGLVTAMMLGRHVIASYPYFGTKHCNTVKEVIAYFVTPYVYFPDVVRPDAGTSAAAWYRNYCDSEHFKQVLIEELSYYD